MKKLILFMFAIILASCEKNDRELFDKDAKGDLQTGVSLKVYNNGIIEDSKNDYTVRIFHHTSTTGDMAKGIYTEKEKSLLVWDNLHLINKRNYLSIPLKEGKYMLVIMNYKTNSWTCTQIKVKGVIGLSANFKHTGEKFIREPWNKISVNYFDEHFKQSITN